MGIRGFGLLDCLILQVPKTDPQFPIVGPYILKSALHKENLTSKVLDLNIEIFSSLKPEKQKELWLTKEGNWNQEESFYKDIYPQIENEIIETFKHFETYPSRYIGFSILSKDVYYTSQIYSKHIRKYYPERKIIYGGPYITELVKINPKAITTEMADMWVNGDGEDGLISILKYQGTHESVNSLYPYQVPDLNATSIPDYSDMDVDFYKDKKTYISLVTSKGCVKNCSFCNVSKSWPLFKTKTPERVVKEVKNICDQTNIKNILFTDNLLNGITGNFIEICQGLRDLKRSDIKYADLRWRGKMVVKPIKHVPEWHFDLIAESGCNILFYGVESGSFKVRKSMNKMFKNEDFLYTYKNLIDRNIIVKLTLIVGYITETEEDFQETLSLLQQLVDYGFAHNTIVGYNKLGIPRHTQVEEELGKLNATWYNTSWGSEWNIPNNTFDIRIDRMNRLTTFLHDNKFNYECYSHADVKKLLTHAPTDTIDQLKIAHHI